MSLDANNTGESRRVRESMRAQSTEHGNARSKRQTYPTGDGNRPWVDSAKEQARNRWLGVPMLRHQRLGRCHALGSRRGVHTSKCVAWWASVPSSSYSLQDMRICPPLLSLRRRPRCAQYRSRSNRRTDTTARTCRDKERGRQCLTQHSRLLLRQIFLVRQASLSCRFIRSGK